MKRLRRTLVRVLAGMGLGLWVAWCVLSLWYANFRPAEARQAVAVLFLVGCAAALARVRPWKRGAGLVASAAAVVTLTYVFTRPANDRPWTPDVRRLATAVMDGDRVTIRNVRDFRYRSTEDFDERWEERTYDLAQLRTIDLIQSYFGHEAYCHTMLSFGFADGEYVIVSAEARKEVGERFSSIGGLFKQFELTYVFADERDALGVRTAHRREDVYLYRLRNDPERLREIFLAYANHANRLADRPEFYDLLTNSCGMNVLKRVADTGPADWARRQALLNGYWDRVLYERGSVDTSMPFEELRALSRVNERSNAALDDPRYSELVRAGLPPAPPMPKSDG